MGGKRIFACKVERPLPADSGPSAFRLPIVQADIRTVSTGVRTPRLLQLYGDPGQVTSASAVTSCASSVDGRCSGTHPGDTFELLERQGR